MEWKNYQKQYKDGLINISMDKKYIPALMTKDDVFIHQMSKSRQLDFEFWMKLSLFLIGIGILCSIIGFFLSFFSSLYGLGLIFLGILIIYLIPIYASKLIIEETLKNEDYYNIVRPGKAILIHSRSIS